MAVFSNIRYKVFLWKVKTKKKLKTEYEIEIKGSRNEKGYRPKELHF